MTLCLPGLHVLLYNNYHNVLIDTTADTTAQARASCFFIYKGV